MVCIYLWKCVFLKGSSFCSKAYFSRQLFYSNHYYNRLRLFLELGLRCCEQFQNTLFQLIAERFKHTNAYIDTIHTICRICQICICHYTINLLWIHINKTQTCLEYATQFTFAYQLIITLLISNSTQLIYIMLAFRSAVKLFSEWLSGFLGYCNNIVSFMSYREN